MLPPRAAVGHLARRGRHAPASTRRTGGGTLVGPGGADHLPPRVTTPHASAWLAEPTPGRPPNARPLARSRVVSRHVCRAQDAARPGSRAVLRQHGPGGWRQKRLRTRCRHLLPEPRHGRSAHGRVSRRWQCRAGTSHPGPRAAAGGEAIRRGMRACASSRGQASRWRGMALGHPCASVARPANEAPAPTLLENPPSRYTSTNQGEGLTTTRQDPETVHIRGTDSRIHQYGYLRHRRASGPTSLRQDRMTVVKVRRQGDSWDESQCGNTGAKS
jgi:hypothetical protein